MTDVHIHIERGPYTKECSSTYCRNEKYRVSRKNKVGT